MTTTWGSIIGFILSTANRVYIGWFGTLMFPLLAIGVHFYPIWESLAFDSWLYNGGTYQFSTMHGSLVTSSLLAESAGDLSLNLGYKAIGI